MCRLISSLVLLALPLAALDKISLEEAEALALDLNPGLQSRQELVDKARYGRLEAWSAFLPSGTFSGQIQHLDQGGSFGFGTQYSSTLGFQQTLWDSKAYAGLRTSRLRVDGECTRFGDRKLQLLFDLRVAYFEAVLGKLQITVVRDNIARLQDAYQREKERLEAGDSQRFDVNQSRVALAGALSDLYTARRIQDVAEHRLRELIGLDAEACIEPEDETIPVLNYSLLAKKIDSLSLQVLEESLDGRPMLFCVEDMAPWEEKALSCNPQIAGASVDTEVAKSQLRGDLGSYLPRVEAFVNLNNSSSGPSSFISRTSYWDMGARFVWDFFDGLGRESRIKQGIREKRSKRALYEEAVLSIKRELSDRFSEIEETLLTYFAARESLGLAKEAEVLAGERRKHGFITPLEYRDSSQQLKEAELELNTASFRLLRAYFALCKTAGKDL